MSIKRVSIYAPQPNTTRASPTQLSVDPKGERIVYTSGRSVFIRTIDNPSECRQYTSHTAVVNVARFSPSGYYVASGDAHGMVRVWDPIGDDMNTKGEFPIISGPIKDLAWDGESKRIIAVGDGKQKFGHCITFDTGNSVGEITGQSSVINSVSIRQQRPYRAATASDDQTIVFYHGTPFKFNTLLKSLHTGFVHGVAFSPDGTYFVSVGADRKIFLFDGKTGELNCEIIGDDAHRGSILSVSWSPDSKRFVTASTDQTVKIWDVETKKNTKTWKFGHNGAPSIPDHQVGVVWTPRKETLIISLSLSGDLNYISEDFLVRSIHGHQKSLTSLTVTKSKTLITGSYDGRVCTWNPAGLATVVEGEQHTNAIAGFVETPSSIISAGWDDNIRHLDPSASLFTSSTKTESQPIGISACGPSTVLLTHTDLRIYASGNSTPTITALPFTPTCLSTSPTAIAIGGTDNTIRIHSATTGALVKTLPASRNTPTTLSYSPTGTLLAAGDSAGKIILYSTDNNEYAVKTTRWAFHTARVESIAWNPAASHVVTGALDCSVYIYSVENPVKKAVVKNAHQGGVTGVAWEGEGETVVSVGSDGAVKRWAVVLP